MVAAVRASYASANQMQNSPITNMATNTLATAPTKKGTPRPQSVTGKSERAFFGSTVSSISDNPVSGMASNVEIDAKNRNEDQGECA